MPFKEPVSGTPEPQDPNRFENKVPPELVLQLQNEYDRKLAAYLDATEEGDEAEIQKTSSELGHFITESRIFPTTSPALAKLEDRFKREAYILTMSRFAGLEGKPFKMSKEEPAGESAPEVSEEEYQNLVKQTLLDYLPLSEHESRVAEVVARWQEEESEAKKKGDLEAAARVRSRYSRIIAELGHLRLPPMIQGAELEQREKAHRASNYEQVKPQMEGMAADRPLEVDNGLDLDAEAKELNRRLHGDTGRGSAPGSV